MVTPKKIIIQDLELADKEIARLRKENKLLKARNEELNENCYGLAKENKELKKKLEKLRTDNIYEEWLYN